MKPASLTAAALLATAPLSLASVNLSASGNLSASTAPVSNPFNGAHFTLNALFPDGNYQDDGASTLPVALSDPAKTSLTISGASNSAYNGTFSLYPGFGTAYYYPTYAGLYGAPANNGLLYFQVATDQYLEVTLFAHPTTHGSAVTTGSAISGSDFSNTEIRPNDADNNTTFTFGIVNGDSGNLTINNGTFTSTTVPEASASALLAAGLAAIAIRRRRR